MAFITTREAALRWGISDRRVRVLCSQGKIQGVTRAGRAWLIPADAAKPADARMTRHIEQVIAADGSIDNIIERIDLKKKQLDSMRPLTAGEVARLRQEFLVEFTYNSNAIEGNSLTLQETALVLEGITIAKKPLKDHLEVIGHKEAFEYVLQLVQDKTPLSERIIKEIHSLVLMDKPRDKGVYRHVPVQIAGAKHTPPQAYLVPVQMADLLSKYKKMKSTMHVVERVAVFHLYFEGIHPFIDGNGRTGRLIMNLELLQAGFPAINVKFADRSRYYECFNSYYETGSSQEMVTLVASYVEEMLDRYLWIVGNRR